MQTHRKKKEMIKEFLQSLIFINEPSLTRLQKRLDAPQV